MGMNYSRNYGKAELHNRHNHNNFIQKQIHQHYKDVLHLSYKNKNIF